MANGIEMMLGSSAVTPVATQWVKTLYRWKDANGRLHITDQAPPDGTTADVIQH